MPDEMDERPVFAPPDAAVWPAEPTEAPAVAAPDRVRTGFLPLLVAAVAGGLMASAITFIALDGGDRVVVRDVAAAAASEPETAAAPATSPSTAPAGTTPFTPLPSPTTPSSTTPSSTTPSTTSAAYLGVILTPIDATLKARTKLPVDSGVMVATTEPDGPAKDAGLAGATGSITLGGTTYGIGGDIIVSADGKPVTNIDELRAILATKQPGDELSLEVVAADGKHRTVKVTLGTRPPESQRVIPDPGSGDSDPGGQNG